jgi:hypothetical protein
MFVARQCEAGPDSGKWYAMIIEHTGVRRAGYCATACTGHQSSDEALAHLLQYQLDREADLWLERRSQSRACEICGASTTLRARLGRNTELFVLCTHHQSSASLRQLSLRRLQTQTVGAR